WQASGIVMKYRVTSGWVTVTGPPFSMSDWKVGNIEPLLPITFPKRTDKYGLPVSFAAQAVTFSATRLEWPKPLVGLAALSVEMLTNVSTPLAMAARSTFRVPSTLVFQASLGYFSSTGRCLSAAA